MRSRSAASGRSSPRRATAPARRTPITDAPFVLNVNDDDATRYLVSRILERSGYRVVEAVNGSDALMLARRRPILIVLDVRLPDIDGLEVCRRLKAAVDTQDIPILQTSATFVSAERRIAGLESGADAYLVQPIEPPELIATARALLRAQRAEREVKEIAREWRETFDVIADAVALVDRSHRLIRGNRAMAALCGTAVEALPGTDLSACMPPRGQQIEDVVARAMREASRVVSEIRLDERLFRLVADPMLGNGGDVERVVLQVADITEHRQLEDDHRRRAEELAELGRRKDEFLGMLAHELRNPLHALGAATSLMDRIGPQDERNVKLRNAVRRQTRHLARLVDDLLQVSRVTRGRLQLQLEPSDLAAILRAAIEHTRPVLEGRNQRLHATLPDGRLPLTADPMRLEQVFVNLLHNASKYSEPGAEIDFACEVTQDGRDRAARIRVIDRGVGIPATHLDAIFDLFVQVDQSLARSLGGLGIGLTIARTLVEMHGGSIRAHSEGEGHGSEFTVDLPLREVAALADLPDGRSDDAVDEPVRPSLILIVEDNDDAREMLASWLTELGHRVSACNNGTDGIALLSTLKPDIALIDIGLPGMDGYEVAERIRRLPAGRDIRLIAVTGYGRPEDSAHAREVGFDAHLVKPVQPEVLARLIHIPRKRSSAVGQQRDART